MKWLSSLEETACCAAIMRRTRLRLRDQKKIGGSGFREKTLRWEIATAGCRSREIGDTPREGVPSEGGESFPDTATRSSSEAEGVTCRVYGISDTNNNQPAHIGRGGDEARRTIFRGAPRQSVSGAATGVDSTLWDLGRACRTKYSTKRDRFGCNGRGRAASIRFSIRCQCDAAFIEEAARAQARPAFSELTPRHEARRRGAIAEYGVTSKH